MLPSWTPYLCILHIQYTSMCDKINMLHNYIICEQLLVIGHLQNTFLRLEDFQTTSPYLNSLPLLSLFLLSISLIPHQEMYVPVYVCVCL